MKKIISLSVLTLTLLIGYSNAFGSVPIENIQLYGDEAFIEKIQNLDNEPAPAKTLYVATTGNDSNAGTIDNPYKTINAALDNASAGTTVYVREGSYSENIYFPSSGSQGKYISLKNYPGENPVITGTNKNDTPMIELDGHDYIHIEGFELRDYSAKWCYGIFLGGGENHIIIRNNTIHNIKCSKPNDPDNSGANGILLFGETAEPISNVYIANNKIYDLVTGWCEALSVTANCEYINVINNEISDCTNIGIDFYGNNADGYCPIESLNQPRYCIAAGNTVSGCVCSYATCYGLYVDGARDILLENNISYGNQGGIEIGSEERNENFPVKNIMVRNNLVYNNTENGITVGGWNDGSSAGDAVSGVVYDTKLYNNTIVNNGSDSGQIHIAMTEGIDIKNNILYTEKNAPFVTSDVKADTVKSLTFGNNIYYSENVSYDEAEFELYETSIQGMAQWQQLTGENGSFADPKLENYRPVQGSAAINSGDSTIDFGSFDLDNNSRCVEAVDAGAYEYQANEEIFVYGDADNSKTLEAADAAAVLQKALINTFILPIELATDYMKYIDVDKDNSITAADAAQILQKVLTSTYKMPVEELI